MAMKMILTGDVNLMNVTDPAVPFALVRDEFRAADIVFCNLECCLHRPPNGHSTESEGFFADPLVAGGALKSAGVEAVGIANNIQYGLSSALYTRDVNKAFAAMRDLEAGITYINAPTIGAEVHLPFGGVKATGNGHREGGMGAIDFYTEWKAIYVDYSDKLQKAQIDRVD